MQKLSLKLVWKGVLVIGAMSALAMEMASAGGKAGADDVKKPEGLKTLKVPDEIERDIFDINSCRGCHGSEKPKVTPVYVSRCNESFIWDKHDKHKDAWTVLKGSRAQRMGKILDIADVTRDLKCISCHGTVVDTKNDLQMEILKDGVNCAVCHGEASNWYKDHDGATVKKRGEWLSLTRKQKEKYWGMTDLWDPARRVEVCTSCHIGNAKEGKVVTHEFYAAGHPPLPAFEMATFCDELPKHWELLAEKRKREPKVLGMLNIDPGEIDIERSHQVSVSSIAAFRANMELMAQQAEDGDAKGTWPELARFDCYACHHELQSESWRQLRGYKGKPGRPGMLPWPEVLVDWGLGRLGADAEANRTKYRTALKELEDAFQSRPFGDPKRVAVAARTLATWAKGVVADLDLKKRPLDKAGAYKHMLELGPLVKSNILDFDSARQVSWAFLTMYEEVGSPWPKEAAARRETLTDALSLKLPVGQVPIADTKPGEKDTYLQKWLERLNRYDPGAFRADFEALWSAANKSK